MQVEIENKKIFVFRVVSSHLIAYSLAGLFAVAFLNYGYLYSIPPLSHFMQPLDSPIVSLGPTLQILRGIIIAFILWFFRDTLLKGKFGFLKIALLIFGFSYISTIGPALGSFEGYIYTTFPIQYHFLGIPETIIYVTIFSCSLFFWYKLNKKIFSTIAIVLVIALILTNILGYLQATKII